MKYLCLVPLVFVVACGGGNGSGGELLDDDTGQQTAEPEPEPQPESVAPVITLDNHVDIIDKVFSIFSGKLYGDDVITAPDYPDPAYYRTWPIVNGDTAELISQSADIVCENGGTLLVVPETTGFHSDNVLTWHFDFDSCQYEEILFEGQLATSIYESVSIVATDFVRDDQSNVIRLSGSLGMRSGGDIYSFWNTNDVEFSRDAPNSFLNIEDSNTEFGYGWGLSGQYVVQASWTDGLWMSVDVDGVIYPGEDVGSMVLSFDSGNVLSLNAETGDVDTVEITVTADGAISTVTQPWTIWSDSFDFMSESGL